MEEVGPCCWGRTVSCRLAVLVGLAWGQIPQQQLDACGERFIIGGHEFGGDLHSDDVLQHLGISAANLMHLALHPACAWHS
jgi:hypothetical protein